MVRGNQHRATKNQETLDILYEATQRRARTRLKAMSGLQPIIYPSLCNTLHEILAVDKFALRPYPDIPRLGIHNFYHHL